MYKRPTRLIAIVVVLLALVSVGPWFRGVTFAASQRPGNTILVPVVYYQSAPPTHDLKITHLGLYQSVQNASNTVSLVAGKPALLRVYAQETTAATPPAVAEVTVRAHRNGQEVGSLRIGPQAVSTQPRTDNLDSTFNVELPSAWLSGNMTFTAEIDPTNQIPEFNEGNNRRTEPFTFRPVMPLELTIVPIHYRDTRTGILYSEPAHDPISDWLLSAFPLSRIDVAIHTPYAFSGDLRQPGEWTRLLNELTAVWAAEVGAGSSHVFYGLIPVGTPAGQSWFEGGVSGLGWIGQRVSLGLDVGEATGEAAGHELGHNFGRRHAPCGNPSSVDPHYPYPNASIGVVGVDTDDDTLLLPGANFDMMSYCGPEWVSDYTYEGLFADQMARGGRSSGEGDGLLLRATLEGDTATALPVYRVDRAPLPAEAQEGYTLELLDRNGAVVATYPATLFQAEETGVTAGMLMAHVPAPRVAVSAARFLRGDAVVAERVLPGTDARETLRITIAPQADGVTLTWPAPNVPVMVQVSDDGWRWTTLAIDVVGGRLALPDGHLGDRAAFVRVVPADGGLAGEVAIR